MTRLLCSICSVLALTASMAVHAQLRDIRLAPELRDYSLPQEAQVQSVASIGNRSLVAWATTAFDPDSNLINVLWMRLLDGATPLLENRIVHSPQARPYGFVLVIASADQFLIFFNDRRNDAPGTYVQRMDFNGNRIGTEQRIDIGAAKNDTINKPKSEVSALTYSWLPGWTFVQVDSARPFVVRDNAVVDTRPLAIDHMQGAYYLAEDTSVAVLRGKSLYFFHNLLDTAAERVITIPQLDSALQHSEIVTRDTNGLYSVAYAVVADPRTFACTYYQITLRASNADPAVELFKDYNPLFQPYSGPPLEYSCKGAVRRRECDNTYHLTVSYKGWDLFSEYHSIRTPIETIRVFHTIFDQHGNTTRSFKPDFSGPFSCTQHDLMVRRVQPGADHYTTIEIPFTSDTVRLTSEAAFRYSFISRAYPNLILDSGHITITWLGGSNPYITQSGEWLAGSQNLPIPIMDTLFFDHPSSFHPGVQPGTPQFSEQILTSNGFAIATSKLYRVDTVRSGTVYYGYVDATSIVIRGLTKNGWINIFTDYGLGHSQWELGGGKSYSAPLFRVDAVGYDHYINALFVRIQSINYDQPQPIYTSYLYTTKGSQGDTTDTHFVWSSNYQRLSPDRWLRWHLADDSIRWAFDVVDTAGTIYHSRTLQLDGDPRSIFVTQNYPDRSTAVIWGGIGGVRGTFLSHSLDILQENVQISQTRDSISYPSAAYRNDTLFVAWEDYRNGDIADVYGAAFTGAPMASGVGIAQNEIVHQQELHIWPNPVRGELQLSYPAMHEEGILELYDALGQRRLYKAIPATSIGTAIAVETLSPGPYVVVLRHGKASMAAHCIVTE